MNEFEITEDFNNKNINIVVIGVGGGGSNMVEYLLDSDISDKVKLIAINTDQQALTSSKIPYKLQIGKKLTKGRGAGMDPIIGREAALENYDDIKALLLDVKSIKKRV